MEKERVTLAADEAVKLFKDNPDWSYKRAIEKAKEMILDEKMENLAKAN